MWLLRLIYLFYYSNAGFLAVFFPVYLNQAVGISVELVGVVYLILPFVALLASPALGVVADRGNPKLILIISMLGNCA